MRISQKRLIELLGQPNARFAVPVFQRVYSWNARQCNELWDDIMRAGKSGEAHFMGLLLYSVEAESWGGLDQFDVIDGQQRMTTVSLLLCALARFLDEETAVVDGVSADDVLNRYLLAEKGGEVVGKLALSDMDRDTLFALVGACEMPEAPSGRLLDNAELFYSKMREPGFDPALLWRGVGQLNIASVLLAAEDSPQLVFESLNSKGMPLSTADRIRNLLVASGEDEPGGLFESRWVPLEESAVQADAVAREAEVEPTGLADALDAWLASQYRSVRIFDESEVYGLFKACVRDVHAGSLERALADAANYCDRYFSDAEFRADAAANASAWKAGKPGKLISEYKMFGD